jgi:hypothetical protein
MSSLAIVRGTMIVATVAWAAGEALMNRSPRSDRWARVIWTIGIALALVHVALAFHLIHGWDHEAAVAATARQTGDLTGWSWGGGVYVNYAFLAMWLVDVGWWWIRPESHRSRSMRFERVRLAVFVFMFFNGAVVFASGAGRLVGIGSVLVVLLASMTRQPRSFPA